MAFFFGVCFFLLQTRKHSLLRGSSSFSVLLVMWFFGRGKSFGRWSWGIDIQGGTFSGDMVLAMGWVDVFGRVLSDCASIYFQNPFFKKWAVGYLKPAFRVKKTKK